MESRCDQDRLPRAQFLWKQLAREWCWREHRRSHGVQWVHLHPRAVKKNFRPNLREKCVSAPPGHEVRAPPSQSKSQFLGQFLLGGLDLDVYLDCLWGRRLKKVVNFFGKKCTPDQNPGYAYGREKSLTVSHGRTVMFLFISLQTSPEICAETVKRATAASAPEDDRNCGLLPSLDSVRFRLGGTCPPFPSLTTAITLNVVIHFPAFTARQSIN